MKTMRVFRALSVLLMVFMTLSIANPAYANTHVQISVPRVGDWILRADSPDNVCGFDVLFHDYGNWRVNYFYDKSGQQIKEVDIYGNLKTDIMANGKSVNSQYQGPAHFEIIGNMAIEKDTGVKGTITIPHYGKVVGGAGLSMYTYTIEPDGSWANQTLVKDTTHIIWTTEAWMKVCEYLGP